MRLGLDGRTVLVTAASQGIGLASARGFHAAGANVAICARSPEALATAAAQMPDCLALPADLTVAGDIDRMVKQVTEHFGTIDVLVNNAGGPPAGLFETLSDDDWHRAVDLTLMSAIRASRAVLPGMQARQWGRIVNISSYGVKQPVPELTLSNSVRMAALGWSKTLASQVARHNILVNTVCPGWTRTARVESLVASKAISSDRIGADIEQDIASQIPLGRLGQPGEIANLVVFLGSEAASYITGTAIPVDGGIVQGYA